MNTSMNFDFEFFTPLEMMVEETDSGIALIKGTLLVEGVSRNGNLYTIDEMQHIADEAIGKEIHYGVKTGINPNTGKVSKNLHDDSEQSKIGKIISTAIDFIKRRITFVGEIANTPEFPDIISKVKAGWGISVGGVVETAKYVLNEAKQICMKIENMIVKHVSLVDPSIIRGQDEAKVESVAVQETMVFDMEPQTFHINVVSGKGVSIKRVDVE